MEIERLLKEKRPEILRLAAEHGATNVRIFGSVARGEAGPDSDVDFLVDLDLSRVSWGGGGLQVALEELLGCKVDLVTENALHWYIRDRVLQEAVPL